MILGLLDGGHVAHLQGLKRESDRNKQPTFVFVCFFPFSFLLILLRTWRSNDPKSGSDSDDACDAEAGAVTCRDMLTEEVMADSDMRWLWLFTLAEPLEAVAVWARA